MPSSSVQTTSDAATLHDLQVRPQLFGIGSVTLAQARSGGWSLEAHDDGFRLVYGQCIEAKVDILYSKVEYAVFDACRIGSSAARIHLHMKETIWYGKLRAQDVQFSVEVKLPSRATRARAVQADQKEPADAVVPHDADAARGADGQLSALQEATNGTFHAFIKRVEALEGCTFEFECPLGDRAFVGLCEGTRRATVCPTLHRLVDLDQWPVFCVNIAEVDLVVFQEETKEVELFDLVFIYQDYLRKPVTISSVPYSYKPVMKGWLNEAGKVWYTIDISINWQRIAKHISRNMRAFVAAGGWDGWFSHVGARVTSSVAGSATSCAVSSSSESQVGWGDASDSEDSEASADGAAKKSDLSSDASFSNESTSESVVKKKAKKRPRAKARANISTSGSTSKSTVEKKKNKKKKAKTLPRTKVRAKQAAKVKARPAMKVARPVAKKKAAK